MAAVAGILTPAVKRLTDFLIDEANLVLNVKKDVEWVRNELNWMTSFLDDAEQKQGNDKRIEQWIADIRAIALKAVSIMDSYKEARGKEQSTNKLLTTALRMFSCISGKTNIYDIGKEIRALKETVSDISRKRVTFGISNISNAQEMANAAYQKRLRDLRITTPYGDDEHFVGFDDDVNKLETQLLSSDTRRSVISIWGKGGLGKTTLARKLYHTNKGKFDLHAWVCVSRDWEPKDLLQTIIKSLKEPTLEELKKLEKTKDCPDLKRYLRNLLEDKLYLVVIDDLWDTDAWEYLRSALPDYQNGSRVITTTRNEIVAGLSNQRTYVHELKRLGTDESWELFCNNAFSKDNGAYSENLEKIGKEMVTKCDGLPLAIIVLGGLLSRKEPREWHNIKKRIWKELDEHSIHISALLNLSYDDLSRELKLCFLYLGIFPEDHDIRSEKLVTLWIAENLISQSEGLDLKEQAERYIRELNSRSLIQVIKSKYGSDSTCRVDDVLRDLAVKKAKNLQLFHIYEESTNPPIEPSSVERIAFRSGFEKYMASKHSYPHLHTLSFLNCRSLFDDDNVTKLLTLINMTFKSLRVLDLEGVKIVSKESELKLFKAMEKLVNLRYLGLFQTDIDELPESIGKLQACCGCFKYKRQKNTTTKNHA